MVDREPRPFETVIPKPIEAVPAAEEYQISEGTTITSDEPDAKPVAEYLADCLRPSTGFDLPIQESAVNDGIALVLEDTLSEVGVEGYELTVTGDDVTVRANAPAGLFMGVQTLRQLLPPAVESETAEDGPWPIPGGRILDYPRFEYRGVHLDVARYFFDVEDVKQYIEHAVKYKCNHLHLHLTDDQGWRIEIEGWPELTETGASTEVDGGEGGYFTREEYADLVTYAQERFVTVVPEVDVPGHTNAALASYAELNPDGDRADPYTGTEVGFSTLAVDAEETYEFLDDVFGQLSALTPGPYLHLGGDEVEALTDEEYTSFLERVADIVEAHDKRPIGWHEVLSADLPLSTVIQYWAEGSDADEVDVAGAAAAGHEFVLSPANHAYLDIKYDPATDLGLDWAGHTSVKDAYDWDPGEYVEGIEKSSVLGVEAAVWTETLETLEDVEFMLFPRLPAVAERGWTVDAETGWDDFEPRLAQQALRWKQAGTDFYRAPEVDWPDGTA